MTPHADFWATLVLFLAALASALAAGFFYTFTFVVMPGLAMADDGVFVAAMRAINNAVRNFAFAFCFFGTPVFCAVAAVLLARRTAATKTAAGLAAAACAIYLIGVIVVTAGVNVPLNRELAASHLPPAEARLAFESGWIGWNMVRTGGALAAFVFILASGYVFAAAALKKRPEIAPEIE